MNKFILVILTLLLLPTIVLAEKKAQTPAKAAPSIKDSITFPEVISNEKVTSFSSDIVEKTKLADSGDSEAQYTLGMMYVAGLGMKKDFGKGLKYLESAAANNHVGAGINLAKIYFSGFGIDKNIERAYKLADAAFTAADEKYKFRISQLFESGNIAIKDQEKSNSYLIKAAEVGSLEALEKLAYAYRTGKGINKDIDLSIKNYEKIYELSSEKDKKNPALQIIAIYSDQKEGKPDAAKIIEWLKKMGTELNDSAAQMRLGFAYRDGKDVEQDYKQAIFWFQKAVENKVPEAKTNLGFMYASGMGVEKDYNKARDYYVDATLGGDENAAWYLSQMYAEGIGFEQNDVEAKKWLDTYNSLKYKKEMQNYLKAN